MMTTMLNNNDNKLYRHKSATEGIQLPPLSHLLNKNNSAPLIPQHVDSRGSVSPPLLHPKIESRSASTSRLPSISDLITPPKTFDQHKQITQDKQDTPTKLAKSEKKAYAFISHSPATFPSHEPSIDNAQLARRKRRRTSPNELSILQREFQLGHTPNRARRQEIAGKVNMTEKAVQIWFQNKRQALRKLQLNDHSIHQTTTITLPEVDLVTSPLGSTPTKYYTNNSSNVDAFATSPMSATSSSSNHELPPPPSYPQLAQATPSHIPMSSHIGSSPLPQQAATQLPPPRPATWTIMSTPAKNVAPVTPVRSQYRTPHHQLPTPNIMSFRLNKKDSAQPSFTPISLPTPASSKYGSQKPFMKIKSLDKENVQSPSPSESQLKKVISLASLTSDSQEAKRTPLGDITASQNSDLNLKKRKGQGDIEGVESLLSLRSGNWK